MTKDRYAELVEIKDTLTREFLHLERLVGTASAARIIEEIRVNVAIFDITVRS